MKRKFIFNLLFIFLLIGIPLFIGEFAFRYFIFSEHSPFPKLKDAGKYAKNSTDDYWKLYYKFGGSFHPPEHPHPLLGWIGFFDRTTFIHNDNSQAGDRRRVLMFGDSYVMCQHDSIQCFHEILNEDTAFNKNNILLNYGVGGYGVDQIYLLFSKAVDKYEKPFVIFSIMPSDMDRSLLSVRTGQKPYFVEERDSLKLCGVPIDSSAKNFFKKNPPNITSYLWRRFVNSKLNPHYDPFPTNNESRKKIVQLNKKIILRAFNEIKKRNLQYVFLIFDELWTEEGNWRVDSLQKFMAEKNILFINTGNLVAEDTSFSMYDYTNYTVKGDGHPSSHYNKLVCEEIKKYILNYNSYPLTRQNIRVERNQNHSLEFFEKKIRSDNTWLNAIKEKAKAQNIPLDSMIKLDAIWSFKDEKKQKH